MTKIYLISPAKIEIDQFEHQLDELLRTGLVSAFQLRLKGYEPPDIRSIAKRLKIICQKNNCPIIINDYADIAIDLGLDGAHLGIDDGKISDLRSNSPKGFIIGASCYDSRHLAMVAAEAGADYLSFGSFYPSKTKKSRGKPTTEIVKWCDEMMTLPIVAIGGIDSNNCQPLVNAGVDFIAVISYIWNSDDSLSALKKLYQSIN